MDKFPQAPLLGLAAFFALAATAFCADAPVNLLRNPRFQDDWLTLLPQNKNHHWCYSSEFYNRRDFNPDGWSCDGNWQWLNAGALPGQRRLVIAGPNSEVAQRINWAAVYDDAKRAGFPDAGGFPSMQGLQSANPLALVRDLTFRVRVKGKDVAAHGGAVQLGLCLPGPSPSEPYGGAVPPLVHAAAWLPEGTFDWQWAEVVLPAARWLEAVAQASGLRRNPEDCATLPATVLVSISCKSAGGEIEIGEAQLLAAAPEAPNLLPNGGFESVGEDGWPVGWERPAKYRYFPPGYYYIFNTWHNANFENRGPVRAVALVVHGGTRSLQMTVPAGDEKSVCSAPVQLRQKEPRLIEVQACVKTDRLCMLQLDALDEKGRRLEGWYFIHKAPMSIGTDDWRLVRQVFRPRQPVESLRLLLCARGVNGYTLDGAGRQPQNTVCGTVWWDDVRLYEPESSAAELAARGITPPPEAAGAEGLHLENLDLGERMLGENELSATLVNPGPAATCSLQLEFTAPSGAKAQFHSEKLEVSAGKPAQFRIPYTLTEPCPAYTEYHATLSVVGQASPPATLPPSLDFWFATWSAPLDLELGALYLLPEQKQYVRMNLGFTSAALSRMASVRLEVLRRGTREVLKTWDIPATPEAIAAQRERIPQGLRGDFSNLLLTDLDVSFLPLQPFNDPQRNWFLRASARNGITGKVIGLAESQPFCRLAHDPPQPAIEAVTIDKNNLLYVNGKPWMPWGVCYGFVPVYDGPSDPGPGAKYRDLHKLAPWSMYDGFVSTPYTRTRNDFNCARYVAASISKRDAIEQYWNKENMYCSSAFAVPEPVWSVAELETKGGGAAKLAEYLAFCKSSPQIVSVAAGIEEAFGLFQNKSAEEIKGMAQAVEHVRAAAGKPVMVGHGGYWNRFEFEKIPFFDIYDPETEPFFPANLHTDLWPLVQGQAKVIWLRPQMYEDVPYERWRFHVWVELMRGCRGWQIAHGPCDQSLFRGLHGEMKFIEPVVYSNDPGPQVTIEPWVEHWSRRHAGKTYIVAATTHGLTQGQWLWSDLKDSPAGRARVTDAPREVRTEVDGYAIGQQPERGPCMHGLEYLPDARAWPPGSKLVQWARIDPQNLPRNLVLLAKKDGRWIHAACWGEFDVSAYRDGGARSYWFLKSFYRHYAGFLGWDDKLVKTALPYIPERAVKLGALPQAGEWVKLEVPLEAVAATGGLLDGVGFLHEGGRVWWARTALHDAAGAETVVCGDSVGLPTEQAAQVAIHVEGLKAGAKIRVLFEDRELTAGDGCFSDDFRGQDLYQRFGGGWGVGYGDAPVALHVYEVP